MTVCGSVYVDTNAPPHVVLMGKKPNDIGSQDPREGKTQVAIHSRRGQLQLVKYQHDESSGREKNSGVMRFCELRKLCFTSCVEKSCSRVAMERANNANLCDCTLACDPDIGAFFTFLWRRKCLTDHIQFVSVYLIASGLHNSRPAKWRQLHGLMGVISNLLDSLVIDL